MHPFFFFIANNAPTPTVPTGTSFPAPVPAAPSIPAPVFPSAVATPAPVAGFGAGFPGDPPTRNTRND